MGRILLVDDDDVFRSALQKTLEVLGHTVIAAENGREAIELLPKNDLDLVLSDIRMPEMDGIALTQFIRKNSTLPIILTTGFSDILETQEAYKLGADAFIPKPFEREDLMQAIQNCLKPEGDPEEIQYCSLSIDDFVSGRQILFNIFVRLSDRKFVKIAQKGEDLSIDRIQAFKGRGLRLLHLRKEDFLTYVGFNLKLSNALRNKRDFAREKKMNLLKHTGEVLLQQVWHNDMDDDLFKSTATFVETTVEILADDPQLFSLLEMLRFHSDYLYAHSVATSLYSLLIAQNMDWKLPNNKFKVAVGGLLHDIGQKELRKELLEKPRGTWSEAEASEYEQHPARSVKVLCEIPSISSDVLQIVNEHHEDCLGQGFPLRIRKSSIHPMAKLVSVANEFSKFVVKHPSIPLSSPTEAFQKMQTLFRDKLDQAFLGALMQAFKYAPTSDPKRKNIHR